MIRTQQFNRPALRLHISKRVQRQALVPLRSAAADKLSLIAGYQAMALINQDIARIFTPCEEEAERCLTKYRRTNHN
ncbi:hypothetical protein KB236_00655 [Levilactobacillus brevis]|uniref:Uncharacterized protein n=1 Tax=Levilactobacillus hammesii TaxID=267633 RepID=A0A921EYX8_9LACO|nr:hypothetical protein KB236_00655 [Levilactobacillus brevis]HJE86023.1 hypothetical protein [Levilactobacillus hammesii]